MSKKKKSKSKKVTPSNRIKGLLREGFDKIALALNKKKSKKTHMIVLAGTATKDDTIRSMDAMFIRASAKTMVAMLYAAGMRDVNFGKALLTASAALEFNVPELKALRDDMNQLVKQVKEHEGNITIPTEDEINSMSKEDMDDYIKKMLGGKKGEA